MLQQDEHGYRLPFRVRYPVELHIPPGFQPDNAATWPRVDGRLEFVGGRLLYMPPCGDVQQDVAIDVAYILKSWSREHPEFVIGGNEAGMILGTETRGADAAVWRKADVGSHTGGFRRVPPVLAVEIAALDEGEPELGAKARWYLGHGVACVWLVLPDSREVVVVTEASESRCAIGSRLPSHPSVPDLAPDVGDFFTQLE
jgi:Uma2 family endonuclease